MFKKNLRGNFSHVLKKFWRREEEMWEMFEESLRQVAWRNWSFRNFSELNFFQIAAHKSSFYHKNIVYQSQQKFTKENF